VGCLLRGAQRRAERLRSRTTPQVHHGDLEQLGGRRPSRGATTLRVRGARGRHRLLPRGRRCQAGSRNLRPYPGSARRAVSRKANVQAARACGWHAVLHTDTAVSIQEITRTIARANRPPLLECEARAPASAHIADRCWLLPPNNLSWPMLCPLSCRGHPAGCSGEGAAARLQGDRRTSHGDPIAAAASPQPSLPWAAHPGSGSIMGAPCAPPAERHQGRSMRGPSSAGRAGQLDPRHTCDPQAELDSRVARYRSTRRSGTSQMMATLVKVSIASQGLTKASAMPNRYRRGEILPLRSRPRA